LHEIGFVEFCDAGRVAYKTLVINSAHSNKACLGGHECRAIDSVPSLCKTICFGELNMPRRSLARLYKDEFTGYSLAKFQQDVLARLTAVAVALPLALIAVVVIMKIYVTRKI
jgi:hypothetical protein